MVALMSASLLLGARPAYAAAFTVNSTDDVGDQNLGNGFCDTEPFQVGTQPECTLRAAIQEANTGAGTDTITVPGGIYTLTIAGADEDAAASGDLDVTDDLTITGAGARATRVVGVGGELPFDDRIFDIQPDKTATITDLSITGGKPNGIGGGVRNEGDLTLDKVAVKANTTVAAGGIASAGGKLSLINNTVSGNSAPADAGGVAQIGGTANITNSTISGNHSEVNGGVAASEGALMNILNSTIATNTSSRSGGGIITAVTGTTVFVKNTIVAGNTRNNCNSAQLGGVISSRGNNITSDGSCGFTQPTDRRNTDPRLGPLQNNGGPTDTRALLAGSSALDAGANTGCPATDQRGVVRPQGPRCDIGAFERRNSSPVARNDSYRGVEDRTLRVPSPGVLKNDTDADGDALRASIVSGPGKGKLTLRPNGAFTYGPKKNFNGTVRFAYRANDGRGGSDRAVVTLRLRARSG